MTTGSSPMALFASSAALALGLGVGTMPPAAHAQGNVAPTVRYEYDAEGQLTRRTQAPDTLALVDTLSHDRLGRLLSHLDPLQGGINFSYRGSSHHLSSVTDPRRLGTSYAPDPLGQPLLTNSPDRGKTSASFNAAGLPTSLTWAGFGSASFSYDALGRVTKASYARAGNSGGVGGGSAADRITHSFLYDQIGPPFSHGIGRLTTSRFPAGERRFRYDAWGRLSGSELLITTGPQSRNYKLEYAYSAAGQLTQITYPSGRVLSLALDDGQPSALGISLSPGAASTPMLTNIRWTPWSRWAAGPAAVSGATWLSWEWALPGGGTSPHVREFDEWGRLSGYPLGPYRRTLQYDPADRIESLGHTLAVDASPVPGLDQRFQYDDNSRLTGTERGVHRWRYAYDANGNRTEHEGPGFVGMGRYATSATSNRLASVSQPAMIWSYDAQGNATRPNHIDAWEAEMSATGQIGLLVKGPSRTRYHYDADARRVLKDGSAALPGSGWTVYVYGLRGELLGEYDHFTGAPLREYLWLEDTPVALVTRTASGEGDEVFFIHADHLDTPRVLTDSQGRVRWRWMAEPFGNEPAEAQPTAGLDALTLPLRMPGQYHDAESGLFYNHHRYYEPRVGRYTQSDPIGLDGGINTYAYVGGNPVSYVDPMGLDRTIWEPGPGRTRTDGPRNGNWGGKNWSGGAPGGAGGTAPPTDSGDECYMRHDQCWARCAGDRACMRACDYDLNDDLGRLPSDSRKWPRPPRPGTERDTETMRDRARWFFGAPPPPSLPPAIYP